MTNVDVLLVEDNPGDAKLVEAALGRARSAKFRVQCVPRLRDALKLLDAYPFDVVLLDLSLPDSHWSDTLVRVRAHRPHQPVVVLTYMDDARIAAAARKQGAVSFVPKGIANDQRLVKTLLQASQKAGSTPAVRTRAAPTRTRGRSRSRGTAAPA